MIYIKQGSLESMLSFADNSPCRISYCQNAVWVKAISSGLVVST